MREETRKRIQLRREAYRKKGFTTIPFKWVLTTREEIIEWYIDILPKTSPLREQLLKKIGAI